MAGPVVARAVVVRSVSGAASPSPVVGRPRATEPVRRMVSPATSEEFPADPANRTPPRPPRAPNPSPHRPDHDPANLLLDPRDGDAEDDASSPKQKSLLGDRRQAPRRDQPGQSFSSPGWPRLCFQRRSWASRRSSRPRGSADVFSRLLELYGIGAAIVLLAVAGVGWIGWRPLFRAAEANFWALNALGVQPGYALCREAIRHLAERAFKRKGRRRARADARGPAAPAPEFSSR